MVKDYIIGGITVQFPYKAYGPQLAYMSKVVATLEQSRLRPEGKCNALLESPTGSGKSLALLCATLAWQRHYKALIHKPAPSSREESDPLVAGGGFIVEDTAPGLEPKNATRREEIIPKVPRIFYATRTHAQITQVIREFRKTKYRARMAILASKKHYCTNKQVLKKKNVDEDCLELLRAPQDQPGCRFFRNAEKVKNHPSVLQGGEKDIHDIEDLLKIGRSVKGCAYFAARAMAMEAEIVFCPYSYIVDPIIREAVEADIRGSIIIFDEAHNIEDVAREAGSVELETIDLSDLRSELEELCNTEPAAEYYPPLLETIQELLAWTENHSNHLTKAEFERHWSCWTGDKALQELREAGIPLESFDILMNFSRKAVAATSDEEANHLSGRSSKLLERLFRVLQYMLQNNGRRAVDYQLVVQKFVRRDKDFARPTWIVSFTLWCLNPAVVFEEISTASRSIIVTSGTLAPVESFASELGVLFDVRIEAPHVVDMETQVWAASLAVGPGGVELNASYKNADNFVFQDAVGAALVEIFKVTPDGVLVFLPSYKLLAKLCDRWQFTGLWGLLCSLKPLFIEPRVNDEKFDSVLQGYYRAIRGELPEKTQPSKKTKKSVIALLHESTGVAPPNGAAFLAVCRGKVSEGIDFSDKNARAVVLIGIPFPNVKDIQVSLKKQYNSTYQVGNKLLSGDQWYCQQAFRALNQAVGRCIRHRYDYGGILLLDDRFKAPRNIEYMSKWLRKSIRQFDSFQSAMGQLQDFFTRIKELDLGPPAATPEEEVPEKRPIALLPGHKKASGPITPVPITPLKLESSTLRVSNTVELCVKSETLISLNGQERPMNSPCLRSGLFPQFEATEQKPTPNLCFGGVCAQPEPPNHGETQAGPQFLTQPPSFNAAPCGNAPRFPSGTHCSTMDEQQNALDPHYQMDFEDENNTVSIADADGPLYSSISIADHDEQLLSACLEPRGQPDPRQGSGFIAESWNACKADQNGSEGAGRHERPKVTLPYAEGCKTIQCRRCGLNLGTLSSTKITTLQKWYLTTLQNSNRAQSFRAVRKTSMYLTDVSLVGSGLVEGPEPQCEGSAVQTGNYSKRQQSGMWVQEDGCVFKPLACVSCPDSYVGVHVLAVDAKNLWLADKVAIFAESIKIDQERKFPNGRDESRHSLQR